MNAGFHPHHDRFGLSVCYDYKTDLFKMRRFIQEEDLFIVVPVMMSWMADIVVYPGPSDAYFWYQFEPLECLCAV